jgi:uncharacterized phage protein gp47/JayE
MCAYFSPYVDSTGFHRPTYSDILDYLIEYFKNIYGQDCYLGNDAADYQWISIIAYRLSDVMAALQDDYNNRSVATATGTALDGLVKLNGITRKSASYSTCTVTLTGTAFTIIQNGLIQDTSGYYWDLPQVVIIGSGGTASVTATCQTIGNIAALENTLTVIASPQYGWASVTNSTAATPGQAVETDEQLRSRQALSTRLASHTMLSGTEAGIAAVTNVTRYKVHENYTDNNDAEDTPPHSITCIVEGGTDDDVASAIFLNRGIGCSTYGGVEDEYYADVSVTDPDTGNVTTIKFRRPKYIPIYVKITVRSLEGYVSSITGDIKSAIVDYLNDLQIGQDLTISALYSVAMAQMEDIKEPTFSVTEVIAGDSPGGMLAKDIAIDFDKVTLGVLQESPEYVQVEVTSI